MRTVSSGPDMESLLSALNERVRLRLLNLIGDQELCVCFFVQALDLPQPTISRHLAFLRRANVVAARRDGLWMHYRIVKPSDPHTAKVLRDVLSWCDTQAEMTRDRARLQQACCEPEKFVRLENVPLPKRVGVAGE